MFRKFVQEEVLNLKLAPQEEIFNNIKQKTVVHRTLSAQSEKIEMVSEDTIEKSLNYHQRDHNLLHKSKKDMKRCKFIFFLYRRGNKVLPTPLRTVTVVLLSTYIDKRTTRVRIDRIPSEMEQSMVSSGHYGQQRGGS